jgi:hypothetical protein
MDIPLKTIMTHGDRTKRFGIKENMQVASKFEIAVIPFNGAMRH